jgi:hypothetical protein
MRLARLVTCACVLIAVFLPPVDAATKPHRPVGVDWGGYHFTGQHSLKSWLARRGVDYAKWARSHPGAIYLLTHATPPKRPGYAEGPINTALTATSAPPRPRSPRVTEGDSFPAAEALLALAFLSLAVAVAPARLMRRVVGDATATARTVGVAAVVGAIALGIIIAYTF